jgi:RNA recognition motif-containing protein
MGQNMKLYLRHALKKADRDIEKKKESLKYKASKKRCNLFVKNFPDYWNEQQLNDLFSYYGDIENLKMERNR